MGAAEEVPSVVEEPTSRRIRLVGHCCTALRAGEDNHSNDEEGADDVDSSMAAIPASSGTRGGRDRCYYSAEDEDALPAVHHPVQKREGADRVPAYHPVPK